MSWDQLECMLSKFNFSFNWKYQLQGDREFKSLLTEVFRILEDDQDDRSPEQILVNCVHHMRPGLTLDQPKDKADLPYEIKFTIHPPHEDFCISKIIILSEARNLELYINGSYEKSSRGIMITMNKGRKLSLFEAEFNLSSYTDTVSNATIKFLSFPCKTQMRIQAVVMKVDKCQPISSNGDITGGPVDLTSVKRFLGSVGRPLSEDAQKMLQSIENYQKSPVFKAQQLMASQSVMFQNSLANHQQEMSTMREGSRAQQVEEKGIPLKPSKPNVEELSTTDEQCYGLVSPEEDDAFINKLNELRLKDLNSSVQSGGRWNMLPASSSQARWTAYLQSRVRAGRYKDGVSDEVPPDLHRSHVNEDDIPPLYGQEVRSRPRPSSIGFVDSGQLDRTCRPEMLPKRLLNEEQPGRCERCGCHGCLSVYNSITTNILAAEQRILQNVDKGMKELQAEINEKFNTVFEMLNKEKVTRSQQDEG